MISGGGKAPRWTDTFNFNASSGNINVEVWDSDFGPDDKIGEGNYQLSNLGSGQMSNHYFIYSYNTTQESFHFWSRKCFNVCTTFWRKSRIWGNQGFGGQQGWGGQQQGGWGGNQQQGGWGGQQGGQQQGGWGGQQGGQQGWGGQQGGQQGGWGGQHGGQHGQGHHGGQQGGWGQQGGRGGW